MEERKEEKGEFGYIAATLFGKELNEFSQRTSCFQNKFFLCVWTWAEL